MGNSLAKVEDVIVQIKKKNNFQDILVDISIAQLELATIDDVLNLDDDSTLIDVDNATVNSLNDVNIMILKLTNQKQNFQDMI